MRRAGLEPGWACLYDLSNMKTIAITIDDATLARLDLVSGGRGRSRLIREAIREYITHLELAVQHARETEIVQRHRRRLAQQARVLVREQARS